MVRVYCLGGFDAFPVMRSWQRQKRIVPPTLLKWIRWLFPHYNPRLIDRGEIFVFVFLSLSFTDMAYIGFSMRDSNGNVFKKVFC